MYCNVVVRNGIVCLLYNNCSIIYTDVRVDDPILYYTLYILYSLSPIYYYQITDLGITSTRRSG